jgi:hypothetical protein
MYSNIERHWVKFVLGWGACFAIRLLPFRPANVEPILAATMPYSQRYGVAAGSCFAFFSIVLFDLFVGQVGAWTWVSAIAYVIVSLGAHWFLRGREGRVDLYVVYGIVGAVVYDALTGLTIGPIFYDQPFLEALTGQIPFTLRHIAGNIVLCATLSPFLYRFVVANPQLELGSSIKRKSLA